MKKLSLSNLRKAGRYLERNGVLAAWYAVRERLGQKDVYTYEPLSERELERQRQHLWKRRVRISVVVPAFRTPEAYMRRLLSCMLEQTYPYWELVVADASEGDEVERVAREYEDSRIRYFRLEQNMGIADNTNRGIELAEGDYIGLLDHDDELTADALFRVAECLEDARDRGRQVAMVYTDEDKCDGEGKRFYEPHRKPDFDMELLLSNNYICHFLVMEAGLMKRLRLRKEFDGAQDYDLVLRGAGRAQNGICHVGRVLYHWRCHEESTAQNPDSKAYAYRAGAAALTDFMRERGWRGRVESLRHLGFYRIAYEPDLWSARPEVGCIGGSLFRKGRLWAGAYEEDGSLRMEGLPWGFSGYMHRGALRQEAAAVDVRFMELRPACYDIFREVTGREYAVGEDGCLDAACLPAAVDYAKLSLRLGRALRRAGYTVLWDPQRKRRIR